MGDWVQCDCENSEIRVSSWESVRAGIDWGNSPAQTVLASQMQQTAVQAATTARPVRVSVPDYAQIERVGELARQFVAQGLAFDADRVQHIRELLGDSSRETAEQTEFDNLPIVTQLDIKEVEEQEWEIVARTTTTRSRKKVKTGRANLSGPTTKNDPVFIWGMQSSKPRAGGHHITYEVRLNDDGSLSCNCPGWIFKKKTDDRGCKHTRHEEVVKNFQDYYQKFLNGESLPTIDPPAGQASSVTAVPRTPTPKDQMQGFGRLIILDD